MAGLGSISATACTLSVLNTRIEKQNYKLPKILAIEKDSDRKQFIPLYINKFRIIALIDSGSDLTLIQEGLLRKILPNKSWNVEENDQPQHLMSASGDKMTVVCRMKINIQFSRNSPAVELNVSVLPDMPYTPVMIFGFNGLIKCQATIKISGTIEKPEPKFSIQHPFSYESPVYFYSPTEQEFCEGHYKLEPFETKTITFYLNKASQVIRSDFVLITAHAMQEVSIIPSRSPVDFNYKEDCFTAEACLMNLTKYRVKGTIWGKVEILGDKKVVKISRHNRKTLMNNLKSHPLGREILPCAFEENIRVPLLTVSKISITEDRFDEPNVRLLDLDPKNTIIKGEPTYSGEVNITEELITPKGLELPTQVFANAAEAIDLSNYNEEIRPFIKDLFITKYPEVVALHAIDAGDLSLTLGLTQIRLRPGEVLPRCKRIFHMSPQDDRHLNDICELLIRFGYLIKAPIQPDGNHLYGMASYLVTRSKPGTLGRLIVDYSPINPLIQSPPNLIPDINNTLQFLQNKALYTSLDLKQAYLSLRVDAESRSLSTFITPTTAYQWTCVPTGMASSPAYWADVSHRMIHSEPVLDKDGKPIYECKNVVKMVTSPLKWVKHYFDDILSTSPLRDTFHETLKLHFEILEKLIKRLAFHGSKISINKSDFAKAKICFLGWYVSNNYVVADPRRIQKIQEFKFPGSKKEMRSFLGLINSLRRVIYLDILRDSHILTPLTSSAKPYIPNDEQREMFTKIKKAMASGPLFNNLVDETAEKYLWVDAATSSGVIGAVLAQKKRGEANKKIVPTCLDLDIPAHRIIFDRSLNYEPVKVHFTLPIERIKPSAPCSIPPTIFYPEKYMVFTDENVDDSLFLGAASILAIYNCKRYSSTLEIREIAVKELKGSVLALKMRNFVFDNNYNNYKQFLEEFRKGQHNVDKNFYLVEALAKGLSRPIILISTLAEHKERPIIKYNHDCHKPPLIFSVEKIENKLVFMPFFHNKTLTFSLDDNYKKLEIIAYMSKTVPEGFRSNGILHLELVAILEALQNFNRFISNVPVTLLTDSKCLYYLFSGRIHDTTAKIKRWCLKLVADHPNVSLRYVRTTENLSDFLTREGLPEGDTVKLNLNIKNFSIGNLIDKLPKETFTMSEWAQYVEDNPQWLTVNQADKEEVKSLMLSVDMKKTKTQINKIFITNTVLSIKQSLANISDIVTPLDILRERLSRSEIVKYQKLEFENIYTACLAGDDFEYIDEHSLEKSKYKLVSDLLMIFHGFYKIYLPNSMIGLLLSFTHLIGHRGMLKMMADLESYYFPTKYTVTKRFINSCYACFLSHRSSRKSKLGVYPMPTRGMQEVSCDLAENLNPVGGYAHLLITRCALSGFTIITPLKTKTASEVNREFKNGILTPFTVERIHSDNGRCFRSNDWLMLMAAYGIKVINTSAINPSARGMAESEVNLVKTMMKKYLATNSSDSYNWDQLAYICTKAINYSKNPITGIKPAQMMFGKDDEGPSFLSSNIMAPPHHAVKTDKINIEQITKEVSEMTQFAIDKITQNRILAHERVNKNRITKNWSPGDIVFVLDRQNIPGNTRPLKLRFNPSPYVVVRCLYSTSLIKRLADSYPALYANDDLKRYDGADSLFNTLPPEITRVLLHKFRDFLTEDFCTIAKFDNFEIPKGITLFDPVSEKDHRAENIIDVDFPEVSNNSSDNQTVLENPIDPGILNDEIYNDDINDMSQIPEKPNLSNKRTRIEDDLRRLIEEDPVLESEEPFVINPEIPSIEELDSDEDEDTGRQLRSNKRVRFKTPYVRLENIKIPENQRYEEA